MSGLPNASHQNPACGACGDETRYDDGYFCEDCQLAFDTDTLEAAFLDPSAVACGQPCTNYWHGNHKIRQGYGYLCGTCELPTGHESMHWTGCRQVVLV